MDATTLYLANGLIRTVKGRAEDIGATLKRRTLTEDDGIRQFVTTDGDTITINIGAVAMTEAARGAVTRATFGFARALENL
jgi:hypothetical protein